MSIVTKHPIANKKVHPSTVIVGNNGRPIDAVTSITGQNQLTQPALTPMTYSSPTVTVNASYDLDAIKNSKSKYTGHLLLITYTEEFYFIDRLSINNTLKTFNIYNDEEYTTPPITVNLSPGWVISEGNLRTALQTTTVAQIDEVHFNGITVDVKLNAARDSVAIKDGVNKLKVNPDGSIDTNVISNATDGNSVAVSKHQNSFYEQAEASKTAVQLDATSFTQLFTYTSTNDLLKLSLIKVVPSTFGTFKLYKNSQVIDYTRNSPTERNAEFRLSEHISLLIGDVIKVEFRPDRIILANYDFFWKLEGYIE